MARTAMSPTPRGGPAPKPQRSLDETRGLWLQAFRRVRAETEARAAHLSAEDQIVQHAAALRRRLPPLRRRLPLLHFLCPLRARGGATLELLVGRLAVDRLIVGPGDE